jgi:hypothetical protein
MVPERMSPDAAESLFAALGPVSLDTLSGFWRGRAVETGHPVDDLLRASSWIGKDFDDPDHVHPLVHEGAFGRYRLDPGRVPLSSRGGSVLRAGPAPAPPSASLGQSWPPAALGPVCGFSTIAGRSPPP